ncbi:dolichol phosphate-mannose biosynthesis regulatory [Scheffersomyces xylosifermentans]|uniref:dolichol phosphate-mannose biosynthesis regulatory n=1 Tax=Scheffersomyces xylosifermentans TaxID=1304137 RepID=UPI00315CDE06
MALDKLIGLAMLAVASAVFTYYTIWVFVLPFVDESNILNSFFLPRDYAIKLPFLLLLIAGLGVGTFIGNVLIKKAEKEKLKKSKKSD